MLLYTWTIPRAHAWARGRLATLQRLGLAEQYRDCVMWMLMATGMRPILYVHGDAYAEFIEIKQSDTQRALSFVSKGVSR